MEMMEMDFAKRWLSRILIALTLSAVYLYGYPSATISYSVVDLFHVALGIILTLLLFFFALPCSRPAFFSPGLGCPSSAVARLAASGWSKIAPPPPLKAWLYAHIALCLLGALFLLTSWLDSKGWLGGDLLHRASGFATLTLLIVGIAAGAWWTREVEWKNANRISNPPMPPESMDREGDGPQGKFFPSSAQTKHGGNIPSKYFMKSDACQRCHADIYKQWDSSMHHFSSFNNQWYRKSIEYL